MIYSVKNSVEGFPDIVYNDGVTKLHTIVETVRHNREVGEQYMTWQEFMDYEKEEAKTHLLKL